MDEHKDEEVSVTNVVEASTAAASDQVDSDDSKRTAVVAETVSTEVRVQVNDQGGKRQIDEAAVAAKVGGSCNGTDGMVGVLGSDICVDGVCVSDSGDGSKGNVNKEATCDDAGLLKVDLERDMKSSGGGDIVPGDLGSEEIRESTIEALNSRTESEVRGSSRITESTAEEKLIEGGERCREVSGGGGDVVDDKGLLEARVVDVGAPVGEISGSSLVEDSSGGATEVVVEEVVVVTRDESLDGGGLVKIHGTSQEVGVSERRAPDQRVQNGVASHSVALDSSIGETQLVVEKSELVEEAVEQPKETDGRGSHSLQDPESRNVGVLHNEDSNPVTKPAGLILSIVEDSCVATKVEEVVLRKETDGRVGDALQELETQTVGVLHNEEMNPGTQPAVLTSSTVEDSTVKTKAEEAVEKPKETGGSDSFALPDLETHNDGLSHNEVSNPGTEPAVLTSSIVKDSTVETKAEEVMANTECLDPTVKAPKSDSLEGASGDEAMEGAPGGDTPEVALSDDALDRAPGNVALWDVSGGDPSGGAPSCDTSEGNIHSSERVSMSTENNGIATTTSKSLDEKTQVAVEGGVVSIDNKDVTSPNVEGMETDAFNENFCFSVEELQATGETVNESTENGYTAFADSQPSYQPTQVIVGAEVAATENKVRLKSEKDEKVIIDKCLERSIARDSAEVPSSIEPEIGVDKQVIDSEQAGLQKEQESTVAGQQKVDTIKESNICSDLSSSCHSTEAVTGGEVADVDEKVLSDNNFDVSDLVALDGMLSSSGHDEHPRTETTCGEIEMDTQAVSMKIGKVLTSDTNQVEGSSENDQQLKVEGCLYQSVSCDPAWNDSNAGQLMEGQEQVVAHAGQLKGNEKKVGEQSSEAETVCVSIKTDTRVTDGGKTVMGIHEEALNLKTELRGSAESDHQVQVEARLDESAACDIPVIESNVGHEARVGEEVDAEEVGLPEGQEMEVEELDTDAQQAKAIEEKSGKVSSSKPGSSIKAHQARYQLPSDDEGEFSVSDLVWGKVRSHPWWPGQIFDPSDASEKAMKYHKKDCFLVAYFGDRTFAWNEASLLKPFSSHFSVVEKQSNSEAFQNAVDCALEEVSRRVELRLACSCIPKDIYDEFKFQVVENTGIREESSKRVGVDKSASADLFEPDKFVEYMKDLAQSPIDGADRLELVIAKAQLLAFYRLKGIYWLPEFQFCGELLESSDTLQFEDEAIDHTSPACEDGGQNLSGQEISQTQRSSYHKRKHNLKDIIYPRKKERSLSELMGDSWDCVDDEIESDGKANSKSVSSSSGKKRKGSDSFADDSSMPEGRKTISLAKVSTPFPKPSFKIGECIQRVASQMTGSPSILKSNSQKLDGSNDALVGDVSDASIQLSEDTEIKRMILPTEYSSLDELLSLLHLAARDPLKGYSFLNIIISFFSDFRNSAIMEQHDKVGGKRRKSSHFCGGSPETFEFVDMSDTYWTDRVIENGSEGQPSRKNKKRDNLFVSVDLGKSISRSNSRKRDSDSNDDISLEKPVGYVDEKAPAELVMHFPVVDSVPSEANLNKMFRRFGPLKEYETEVDKDTNRARVVFKRCSDAEAAYGSAPKFNIFGPMLVNYQLNHTISVPFKTLPIATAQGEDDATLFLQY